MKRYKRLGYILGKMDNLLNLVIELNQNSDTIPLSDDETKLNELKRLTQNIQNNRELVAWYKCVGDLDIVDVNSTTWKALGEIILLD